MLYSLLKSTATTGFYFYFGWGYGSFWEGVKVFRNCKLALNLIRGKEISNQQFKSIESAQRQARGCHRLQLSLLQHSSKAGLSAQITAAAML
ncbi:MAG: hypothetical protein EBU30_00105 [Synechococcaceae bacterium WB6_3B_236]|nr:hypothetical protein [Synechococcaceae bacterium WB6_3B_236]